jgi:hypothetical protein
MLQIQNFKQVKSPAYVQMVQSPTDNIFVQHYDTSAVTVLVIDN